MNPLDLPYYRQREQAERVAAALATSETARAAHLELAGSYRAVIEAYERLEALRAAPSAA